MSTESSQLILLVEDEAIIALSEKLILEKFGYRVIWTSTGEKAVESVQAQPDIELVLMDINLGKGMDGTQAATRILEYRELPLIFLSSHTERDVVEKTEGISSYGYIVKNSGETVLIASIKMAFRLFNARLKEKKQDTALRAYEERLLVSDKIFIHSIDLLCIAGFDGYFKVLNPSWERTLGWSAEELKSKPWLDFVHPDDRDSTGHIRTVLVDGRPVHQFENRYVCKNGEIKWLSWNSFPYPEEGMMFGVARDVSEQRRLAEALVESEATYKALFEKSPMGIAYHQMIYDRDGSPSDYRILAANERFKELTGIDATGMLVTEAFPGIEKDPFDWIASYGEVAKTGKELRFQQHFAANNRWYDCAAYQYKPDHFVVAFLEVSEQKKAELALHAEKERLAITLQSIGDAVIATDTAGRVEVLNGVAERLTGWTQERAKGRPLAEVFSIVNALSRESCDNPVARVLQDGKVVGLANHTLLLSADGGEYQIADSAAPIRDAEGTIIGVVLVFRDVSGEYETAQALYESEARFKALHNASFGGIAIHDKGIILECNLGLSEMTGYTVEELIGMNGLLLIAEGSRDQVLSRIASGYELPYEATGIRKNGEEYPLRLEARNIPYKGRMTRTVEFRDISGDKEREDQLRGTIHYLQSILQTTQDGFFVLSSRGLFLDVNDSFCAMSGYTRGELLAMDINGVDADEKPEDTAGRIERIKAVGSETFSTRHRRKDGSLVDVEMSVSFLEEGEGSFVCFCRDVSERKRAEHEIGGLLKDKELLLKESHHRIKNNMGLIYSLLSLQANAQIDERNKAILNDAAGRVQSMLMLYDRLYRSENFYELSIQAFLPALVKEIVGMAAGVRPVCTQVDVDDFILNSKVLSTLGIIVNELITNSIKYAFGGSADAMIRISASKSDGIVCFIYADNGTGLASDAARQGSGGFGMQLIEMMAQQLDASMELDGTQGVRYTLRFKA
ncbi:MAG TPA: hypothetical protein DCG47_12775 [Spirochaetaceae bacterium]|jgi:PAS domain S-box-containing protein|nr:hypothetical protein [Spirochaetaceae bacterium]